MDGPQFIKQLQAFAKEDVPELVQTVHRKIALEGLTRLVLKTAVDTGRARANWQVAIGRRPQGEVAFSGAHHLFSEPPSQPPPLSAAGQQAVEDGQKVIEQIRAFAVSHTTNNVAYIIALEEGHSRQGGHMLEMTFEELVGMFA